MAAAGSSSGREAAEELFTSHIVALEEGGEEFLAELCETHPNLAPSLREIFAEWRAVGDLFKDVIPGRGTISADLAPLLGSLVQSRAKDVSAGTSTSRAVIESIRERLSDGDRYEIQEEFARGGMGAILRVFDRNIRREMAMKVMLQQGLLSESAEPELNTRAMGRFLDEAQITGQLEHPGVVPVHELGIDDKGQVYFTMKLVQGEELGEKYKRAHGADEDWTRTRVLGVLLRVCEAMSYAHSKGVIHRDLKPENVMVGEFGEVYVMDWGLARIMGREDIHGEALSPANPKEQVVSDRLDQRDVTPGSTMFTMEGDVMGTPSYMPPEQARGEIEEMDHRSDVYAIGAMLYHLLSGRRPYQQEGEQLNVFTTLLRLIDGPPAPLHEINKDTPPELEAICEKAMCRDKSERYADMRELADDLRSFLEGRVVAAYQTGALAELKMWVRRNKSLASSLVAGVLVLMSGVVTTSYFWNESSEQAASVLRLEDTRNLELLWTEARDLWPATEDNRQALKDWLVKADLMLDRLSEHEEMLGELRAGALPRTEEELRSDRSNHPLQGILKRHQDAIPVFDRSIASATSEEIAQDFQQRRARSAAVIEEITARIESDRLVWNFEDSQKEWWHGTLESLLSQLEILREWNKWEEGADGQYRCGKAEVERRVALIDEITRATRTSEAALSAWAEAQRSIADEAECPAYGGMELTPQWGLLPIGQDPRSRLWEFAHYQSGSPAPREEGSGTLELTEDSGIVFVLVPAGSFWMGAQSSEVDGQNYDPAAGPEEGPVHEVSLDAFFLAKHEVTQAQWSRVAYSKPSQYAGGIVEFKDPLTGELLSKVTRLHPVERVTWAECDYVSHSLGLQLPSEAQWEYAARAGTETPWWTGRDPESLIGAENLCDQATRSIGEAGWVYEDWSDGFPAHAPLDTLQANPWGFHHILGNVGEWMRDNYAFSAYQVNAVSTAGDRDLAGSKGPSKDRSIRGPGWFRSATGLRVSARYSADERVYKTQVFGLRPSRPIED
jgi:serine/threonine protein kinase/formylglycine-generating enzyme required for sulfatase activity